MEHGRIKSKNAFWLAAAPGLLGLLGLGHFYLRRAWILTLLLGITEIAWISSEFAIFSSFCFFFFYSIIAGMGAIGIILCLLPTMREFYSSQSSGRNENRVARELHSGNVDLQTVKAPTRYLIITIIISALTVFSSHKGIFVSSTYARETLDWATQARAQDISDIVGIATLLISAYFMGRGSIRWLLVWSGSLFFLIYAFSIFTFAAHYNSLFLLYVAIFGLLVYTFLGGVLRLDFESVKELWPAGKRARLVTGIY